MSLTDLGAIYLVVGVACAVAIYKSGPSRNAAAIASAAIAVPLWPLWAPIALTGRGSPRGAPRAARAVDPGSPMALAADRIEASLREKETLLQEIHHRVKNNLQITSSLLKLQSARVGDEASRRALTESQSRIHAIALVHEMLYRAADLSRIDFAEYARRLVEQIGRTQDSSAARIIVAIEIDPVRLTIDSAVPCGLLVGELVSNCFKHAFPGGRRGRILVRLRASSGACELDVIDDGVGLPPGVDAATPGSLGIALVRALAKQLQGTLALASSDVGTTVRVTMPPQVARPHER